MKILFVAGEHAYGDPRRGLSYEHANMVPSLRALGHDVVLFEAFNRHRHVDFAALNVALIEAIESEAPELVLYVLQHFEIWTETLSALKNGRRPLQLNWGTDDSWKYRPFARFVAPCLDFYATTSLSAFQRAQADGHRNFLLTQWAANDATLAAPLPASKCRYDVSFVGAAYGNRKRWIESLRERGIVVECFGHGWRNGPVSAAEVSRIFRESVISLNFADSALHWDGLRPYRSRQIKARVFEVPGAGGFLLTEPAEGLERYYRSGSEVATFDSLNALVAHIRYFTSRPAERDQIAQTGYERTRRDHTYSVRLQALLDAVTPQLPACDLDADRAAVADVLVEVRRLAVTHPPSWLMRGLKAALVLPFALVFGRHRGARAARRVVYALSWRLAGARTFSVRGWSGRLFYPES